LKPSRFLVAGAGFEPFWVYLRGIETVQRAQFENGLCVGFESTYEELKL